jgi:hypothetical protein
MREWWSVALVLGLGCASPAAPTVEAPESAPKVEAPEPSRPSWVKVLVAGDRVCATDERSIEWCWHAADLDAEPLAIEQVPVLRSWTSCGSGPRSYSEMHWRLRPEQCYREAGEVDCFGADSIQACSLHASGQVYCRYEGTVARVEGVEGAAGLVMTDEAVCALNSEGRAWCWASDSKLAVELSVPIDEPSIELKLTFDRETGLLELRYPLFAPPAFESPLFAPLRQQLGDRFDALFGPYELSFGIPELVLTRASRA